MEGGGGGIISFQWGGLASFAQDFTILCRFYLQALKYP